MTQSRLMVLQGALVWAVALTGCFTSPHPNHFPPARSPSGAVGTVYLTDGRDYSGELLSASDTSVVVLVGHRVAVTPLRHVQRLSFRGFACGQFPSDACLSPRSVEDARAVSRFPFGIPAPAFRALLERGNQTAPDSLKARNR